MTKLRAPTSKGQYYLFALVATLMFIVWHGYFVNTGDQEDHLPQVYKMFNPDLYPHDYFMVHNAETFSIRFYFRWLVYLCALLVPVSVVCFVLTFISVFVSAWAVSRISGFFHPGPLTAFLAPVFLLVPFISHALGDNSYQDNGLLCSTISVMFCTLALLGFFRKQYMLMAFFAAMAGWFQIIESLVVIILLTMMMLIHDKRPIKEIVITFLMYLVVASPMLGPMIYLHLFDASGLDKHQYYRALYEVRNPNHYLPSRFYLIDYFKFALFMGAAVVSSRFLTVEYRKFVYQLTAVVIGGMLVYYVMLEHLHILIIGKTQWFKASIWLTLIYSVCLAVACDKLLLHYFKPQLVQSLIRIGSVAVIVISPFLIFFSKYIPIARINQNMQVGMYQKSDLTLMHEWIESNTPVDAVFMTSPTDNSFLCEAKRSLLIGYKSVIHEPFFMIPWAENFQRINHFDLDTLAGKSPYMAGINGFNTWYYEPLQNEKLDFRLDNLSTSKIADQLGPIVHKQGDLVLTKVIRKNIVGSSH